MRTQAARRRKDWALAYVLLLPGLAIFAGAISVLAHFPVNRIWVYVPLLLVPIAAIQGQLGMEPVVATLTGPLPGLEGWSPLLLSVQTLCLGAVLVPWPAGQLSSSCWC